VCRAGGRVAGEDILRRSLLIPPAIAAFLAAGALPCLASDRDITGVSYEYVARLTGTPSVNNTAGTSSGGVDIGGCDLGHTVNYNGKTYFLLGDTFSGETPTEGGNWRNNTMAYSTDSTPSNGITFDGWVYQNTATGAARQVISATHANGIISNIPTGAVAVNGSVYAWYMAVNHWGDAGDWTLDHAGLARWDGNVSQSFSTVSGFSIAGTSNFGMVAASQRSPYENVQDEYVYIWGTPSGRYGGVKLARVLPANIENLSSYQYYNGAVNGQPQWGSSEVSAALLIAGPVGEMSVMYNRALSAWTLLTKTANGLSIYQSDTPWGTWSAVGTVTGSSLSGRYAPYMNPWYVENDGKSFYFTMSYWSTYDVYWYKATLTTTANLYWTGLAGNGGAWSTGTTSSGKNWALAASSSTADYAEGDAVSFDDRVGAASATVTLGQNVNPRSVTFNNSGAVSYTITSGTHSYGIGGTTSLTLNGVGTVTLLTNNTYSGATTINAGTLRIGGGSTTGSIAGNVVNNGALVFNRSNAYSFGYAISGTGSVSKWGTGTLTLSGSNTYTGPTYVNAGALVIQGTAATAAVLATTSVTDISAGQLVFSYSGSATGASISSRVSSVLKTSYNGGTDSWACGVIHSTLANSNSANSYALGWLNNGTASTVTVKVVLYGDATLDGIVNVYDLGQVLANYNKAGTWATGDFNYDGTVNIYDLGMVLANYNESLSFAGVNVLASEYPTLDAAGVASLEAAGVTVVPEPGSLGLLAVGAIGLLAASYREAFSRRRDLRRDATRINSHETARRG
jgi:autotransporter-associated beta strand protein